VASDRPNSSQSGADGVSTASMSSRGVGQPIPTLPSTSTSNSPSILSPEILAAIQAAATQAATAAVREFQSRSNMAAGPSRTPLSSTASLGTPPNNEFATVTASSYSRGHPGLDGTSFPPL